MRSDVLAYLALSASLVAGSCRDPSSSADPTIDVGSPDTRAAADADAVGDATPEVATDTDAEDRDAAPRDSTPREEQLARFAYQKELPSCSVGDCIEGVAVQFVSKELIKITSATRLYETLEPADYDELRDLLVDDDVVRKMKEGWSCGDRKMFNSAEHQFETRLRFSDATNPQLRTISGCIPRNSPHRDAERVRRIVDTLESMRRKYFDNG